VYFWILFVIIVVVIIVVVVVVVTAAAAAVQFPYFTAVLLVLTTARVSPTKHCLFTVLPKPFRLYSMY